MSQPFVRKTKKVVVSVAGIEGDASSIDWKTSWPAWLAWMAFACNVAGVLINIFACRYYCKAAAVYRAFYVRMVTQSGNKPRHHDGERQSDSGPL